MSIGFTGIQANKDYMFISVNNEKHTDMGMAGKVS